MFELWCTRNCHAYFWQSSPLSNQLHKSVQFSSASLHSAFALNKVDNCVSGSFVMPSIQPFSSAVQPKFSGDGRVDLRLRHYSTREVDSKLLLLLELVQLGLVVAFLTPLASFETTTISAISPYKYLSLVHLHLHFITLVKSIGHHTNFL